MIVEMRTATITGKGQIVIPKALRNKKAFREGSKVAIIAFKDRLEIRPLGNIDIAIASQDALARTWNTKREDKAWKHL
jgi:AbrB family looped-hinge helix DNA binding protein